MEFRHLRAFAALAEELHFGRAARRLSLSQPPLSLAIQQLEATIGARLFTRNSKSVQLTAAGRAFLPEALALLERAQRAQRHAREVAQGQAGTLQVGFVGTMLYRGLPQMLRKFQSRHPQLRLLLAESSSQEQLVDLVQERLDVGFVHTTGVPGGLSQILVARQAFAACLPAGHALAARRSLPLALLAGEPFAVVSRTVSPDYHERIVAACNEAGFEPDIRYQLRHWHSVVSLVAQGLGVALVPAALRQAGIANAVFVALAQTPSAYDTHCLWKAAREHAALTAFIETVRATAAA